MMTHLLSMFHVLTRNTNITHFYFAKCVCTIDVVKSNHNCAVCTFLYAGENADAWILHIVAYSLENFNILFINQTSMKITFYLTIDVRAKMFKI